MTLNPGNVLAFNQEANLTYGLTRIPEIQNARVGSVIFHEKLHVTGGYPRLLWKKNDLWGYEFRDSMLISQARADLLKEGITPLYYICPAKWLNPPTEGKEHSESWRGALAASRIWNYVCWLMNQGPCGIYLDGILNVPQLLEKLAELMYGQGLREVLVHQSVEARSGGMSPTFLMYHGSCGGLMRALFGEHWDGLDLPPAATGPDDPRLDFLSTPGCVIHPHYTGQSKDWNNQPKLKNRWMYLHLHEVAGVAAYYKAES